ncbi:MAG: glutamate 5-kinase, partial [Acidimicrobiia bacterium]|nr:glutamate 5-kinase [Acidimicrobiia bacterium]
MSATTRVVVKIGTSSLTDERGEIDDTAIGALSAEIAALRGGGHEVIVVSSGAVAAGVAALGLGRRPSDTT